MIVGKTVGSLLMLIAINVFPIFIASAYCGEYKEYLWVDKYGRSGEIEWSLVERFKKKRINALGSGFLFLDDQIIYSYIDAFSFSYHGEHLWTSKGAPCSEKEIYCESNFLYRQPNGILLSLNDFGLYELSDDGHMRPLFEYGYHTVFSALFGEYKTALYVSFGKLYLYNEGDRNIVELPQGSEPEYIIGSLNDRYYVNSKYGNDLFAYDRYFDLVWHRKDINIAAVNSDDSFYATEFIHARQGQITLKENHITITKYDRDAEIECEIQASLGQLEEFDLPYQPIFVDKNDNMYYHDIYHRRVYKYDDNCTDMWSVDVPAISDSTPADILVQNDRLVYYGNRSEQNEGFERFHAIIAVYDATAGRILWEKVELKKEESIRTKVYNVAVDEDGNVYAAGIITNEEEDEEEGCGC